MSGINSSSKSPSKEQNALLSAYSQLRKKDRVFLLQFACVLKKTSGNRGPISDDEGHSLDDGDLDVIHIEGEWVERFFSLLTRLDETARSLKTAAALFPKIDRVRDGELSPYITTIGYAMALDVMISELMDVTRGDDFGQIARGDAA